MLKPEPKSERPWTPERGIAKAAVAGLIVAVIQAALLGVLAVHLPTMVYQLVLRTAISFGVCWLQLRTVEYFGGAAGWPFTTVAVVLSLLVMVSNFAFSAWATGAPAAGPPPSIAVWVFIALNLTTIVGIWLAVWITAN